MLTFNFPHSSSVSCPRVLACVCVTQMVQVHQETVDLYFEDIILETLEQTTDQQAREEIHTMAKKINDIAYAMEEG